LAIGGYQKAEDLPASIPVFPLDGALLLPGAALPLIIFEPRYIAMVDDAMSGRRLIGMVQTAPGAGAKPALSPIGCVGRITSYSETGDGRYLITLTGICRYRVVEELDCLTPYRQVRADFATFETDIAEVTSDKHPPRRPFMNALKHYLDKRGLSLDWKTAEHAPPDALVASLSMALPFDPAEKQALLEAPTLQDRYETLVALLEIDGAVEPDDDPPSLQ
jgi:Lon protease-like protein